MNGFASMSLQWIKDHLDYPHEYCLIWPFAKNDTGRGVLQYESRAQEAHRVMCRLLHGEPPTPEHEAAHECGNGHLGCANPNHIKWKTVSENHFDTARHGRYSERKRLRPEQVEEIRALQGKELQKIVAKRYGVSSPTISHIWYGRTHTAAQKLRAYTEAEDEAIRTGAANGMSFPQIALQIGRSQQSVLFRAGGLGIKSGYDRSRPRASR